MDKKFVLQEFAHRLQSYLVTAVKGHPLRRERDLGHPPESLIRRRSGDIQVPYIKKSMKG